MEFDELDKKCIEKLSLISDVFTSTYNKIAGFFSKCMEKKLRPFLEHELKPKRGWKIVNMVDKEFFILSDEDSRKKTKSLHSYLWYRCYIEVKKEYKAREKGSFTLDMGHYFDHIGNNKYNFFYYGFYRSKDENKKFGMMNEYSFYEKISKQIRKYKDYELKIEHPSKTGNEEVIELRCRETDDKKLDGAFNIFKKEILKPIIDNL